MLERNISTVLNDQRQFFAKDTTKSIPFRLEQLKKLKRLLETHEAAIAEAIHHDLGKSPEEALLTEILLVKKEIKFVIDNLKSWAKPDKQTTPFSLWLGRSEVYMEPYGSVCIIGPWNYPFLLVMLPLVGAMAAGNCVVIKPSEITTHTQDLMLKLINSNFPSEYIYAHAANPEQTSLLLQEQFDYLFFTGGARIGKIVMAAAAKHLTPVTLELGGKSPCIIDETANLDFAARRVAWGKTINAGQTCIAPDYLYIHESCKDAFIAKLTAALQKFYGQNPEESKDYGRVVNQQHFQRLSKLLQNGRIVAGGQTNEATRYIAPTVITDVTWNDPIMQEEIFGPILPIFTFTNIDDVIQTVKSQPKPLALYVFTENKETERKVLSQISFGGGCVNDVVVQITNQHLPFGGVGQSGMGKYHGKSSFETFSHAKSVFTKTFLVETGLEYPPYTDDHLKWVRRFM